ncbi:MAG: NAD(P)H-hydrate dehydratase [Anaerolineales bacterium]|nr:NAD(P)H-hydrate dehydratase [Anaerolineales bacterium]MCB9172266.1 NAD(P)H-hydrate dehydratase [Ardenticatenales bacterium]
MSYLYTIEQMQALERAADANGTSYAAMMETAGQRVVDAILAYAGTAPRAVMVLVGPGNNGGDGLVVARLLAEAGWSVVVAVIGRASDDPRLAALVERGVALHQLGVDDDLAALYEPLRESQLVVDALFGTGLSRSIAGLAARLLAMVAQVRAAHRHDSLLWLGSPRCPVSEPEIVAVDCPSGIHGDSGEVDSATLVADLTVTFAGPKQGMLTASAAPYLGSLVVADIGIPAPVVAEAAHVALLLTPQNVAEALPPRPLTGHKGTFGTLTIVAGSRQYVGAPSLVAQAAGRSGTGLVELAVPDEIQPILAAHAELTTAIWRPLPSEAGAISEAALPALLSTLDRADALVVGPGLGLQDATGSVVWQLLTHHALPPTVVDADALTMLSQRSNWWHEVRGKLVLTPHPGEMARLIDRSVSASQADRRRVAQAAAQRWQQVVVLKGAFTVVAAPDGRVALSPYATDALAKAGSGDLLAGIIGGLLAQGATPWDAACVGVEAHGAAGQRLARCGGNRSTDASALLRMLHHSWATIEQYRNSQPQQGGDV